MEEEEEGEGGRIKREGGGHGGEKGHGQGQKAGFGVPSRTAMLCCPLRDTARLGGRCTLSPPSPSAAVVALSVMRAESSHGFRGPSFACICIYMWDSDAMLVLGNVPVFPTSTSTLTHPSLFQDFLGA